MIRAGRIAAGCLAAAILAVSGVLWLADRLDVWWMLS